MTEEVKPDKDESARSMPDKVLDYSLLLSVADGDANLLRLLCALFLRSYPSVMTEIRDAIARNDGETLARAAHTLRGSAGYFVTDSTRSLLTDLEMIGDSGDLTKAPARLVDLEQEMERIKPELCGIAEKDAGE
jgi:HPt (histidine-containing phosphotransfer) domain-containing protein